MNFRPIHPFPARMAPELAWDEIPEGGRTLRVLDPMAGSGTTIVAARLRGHEAIGFDRDPLAVVIAGTWASSMNKEKMSAKAEAVLAEARHIAQKLRKSEWYPQAADEETKKFVEFWFDEDNRRQLASLALAIKSVRERGARNLLWCAFSRLIITKSAGVSLALDVSHSRPHKEYDYAPHRVFDKFLGAVKRVLDNMPFDLKSDAPRAVVAGGDARKLKVESESVDITVTSPPYLNAIDYLRGHRLSLVWFGYDVPQIRGLRSTNVGSEVSAKVSEEDSYTESVLASVCQGEPLGNRQEGMLRGYIRDLKLLVGECYRVSKKGGKAVFVIGDCNIKRTFVSNSGVIESVATRAGFKLEAKKTRPLPENRRYLPPPSANGSGASMQKRMREEVILTFRR